MYLILTTNLHILNININIAYRLPKMAEFYSLTFISLIKLFQLLILIRKNGKKLTFCFMLNTTHLHIFDHEYAYQWILPFSYYIKADVQ